MANWKKGKVRSSHRRRFTPASMGGSTCIELEQRALTAPALWQQPGGTPGDGVTAGSNSSNTYIEDNQIQTVNGMIDPATSIMATSSSISFIEDLGDPSAPADPIGNFVVSFATTGSVQFTATGTDGTVGDLDTGALGSATRTYVLADDTTNESASAILVETFTAHVNPLTVNDVNASAYVYFQSPAVTVQATGMGTTTFGDIWVGPAEISGGGGSGTVTGPYGQITYSANSTDISVTAVSSVGNLSKIARDSSGNVTGFPWKVTTATSIGTTIRGGTGDVAANGDISSHYTAYFLTGS